MTCKCGHSGNDHLFSDGTEVCKIQGCWCMCFNEAIGDNSVIPRYQKYLEQYEKTEDKVRYILEYIPETRNLKNKDFVFFYWHMVHKLSIVNNETIKKLTDPESIRRCRQLLVQHNPEKYGETNPEIITEKVLKERGTYQYVMEKYL